MRPWSGRKRKDEAFEWKIEKEEAVERQMEKRRCCGLEDREKMRLWREI
jgi:hypothetical protein